ncbi:unnamed protein product [Parajaminaea phylloscopi]
MASLIPPKQPRRKGMPTLSIPARPASSSGDAAADAAAAAASQPQQRRPTPLIHSYSNTGLGQDENAGAYDGYLPTPPASSNALQSIYPDTVPGPLTDQAALTNDLRRAIKGSNPGITEDFDGERSRSSYGSSSRPTSHDLSHDASKGARNRSSPTSSSSGKRWGPLDDGHGSLSAEGHEDEDLTLKGQLQTLSRLGEGASGEVRKAKHLPSGTIMAVKTIPTSPNQALHRQILREVSFNRTCQTPYIVRYFGAFLSADSLSIEICMEFCEGGSLDAIYKQVKARNGRTGEKILGKVAECVLKGLDYLHDRRIVHRDIKPSNIVVTRNGQIKLCDFGVSGELVNSLAGTFTGTSFYMAPERIRGQSYTITSDVWSLGLTILEVASNRFPFPPEGEAAMGPIELLTYIIGMKTPELQDDPAGGIKWSRALRDFIERCLEKDPEARLGPKKMLTHPFVRKSETRQPQPDVGKFVADVWGWPYPAGCPTAVSTPTSALAQQVSAMSMDADSPAVSPSAARRPSEALLARMPSLRKAPVTPSPLPSTPLCAGNGAPTAPSQPFTPQAPILKAPQIPQRRSNTALHQTMAANALTPSGAQFPATLTTTPPGMAPLERPDALGRSEADRQEARRREREVGVIGSPIEDGDGGSSPDKASAVSRAD